MTFAWSKWAGLPLSSGSFPLAASWILAFLSPSGTLAQGRFLGHLDAVVVPAQLGMAAAPHSVALMLAQLSRAEHVPQGPAEPRWLHLVAKMLQMQGQLCGYGVPGCGVGCQVPVGCSGGCHPTLGRKLHRVHPWIRPSCDGLVGSSEQSCLGAQANLRWWWGWCPPTVPRLENGAVLPAAGNLDCPFTAKTRAFYGEHGCAIPQGAPYSTHPAGTPLRLPPYKLAHAWAQPGLLYPQTLFMWHIYSKDWNN